MQRDLHIRDHFGESMVEFVDPGFYVSEWTIDVNYNAPKPNTTLKIEYDGIVIIDDLKFEKAERQLSQSKSQA